MLRGRRHLVAGALGVLLYVVAYWGGINTNLLFLMLVLSAYTTLVLLVGTLTGVGAVLALCFSLLRFPLNIPVVKLVEPGQVDADERTSIIPAGQTWHYSFTLTDFEKWRRECGPLAGTVYINGIRLTNSTVDIRPIGTSWLAAPKYLKAYSLDEVQLTPELRGIREFSVSLAARDGSAPAVRQAPETDGVNIYHDAVFLELKSDRCSVLYHALRRAGTDLPLAGM